MGEHGHTDVVGETIVRARSLADVGPLDATGFDPRVELGELLIELADEMRVHLVAAVAADDLTMPQAMVMRLLDRPRAMRELAAEMHYDASTITSLVDRLEERGLVRRDPHPTDRRVKQVTLTRTGKEAQARTEMRLCERLPILDRLTVDQQRMLLEILRTAVRCDHAPG